MLFGDVLRNLLEEKNITQKQMANDLNLAASTLGNYIRNTREPDFNTLCRIANYFNVSVDYLLDYHPTHHISPLENELLRVFATLTPEQQEIYIEQGKAFVK